MPRRRTLCCRLPGLTGRAVSKKMPVMRFISFDSVGGASGDMLLGALLDLGAELQPLAALIRAVSPEPVEISVLPAADRGLHGLRVDVRTAGAGAWITSPPTATGIAAVHAPEEHAPEEGERHGHGHHAAPAAHHACRGLREILAILEHPALPRRTRALAAAAFRRLAEAEAKVHGVTPDAVHFHEVGAADAIADIVGCCFALEQLGVEGVRVGPLPAGRGTLHCAHGEMPNPAPATIRLLEGFEIVQTGEPFELVTPTGAALLAAWRHELAAPPDRGRVLGSGCGFGRRTLRERPNLLRATLMESVAPASAEGESEEELVLLETNLDDCNPQWIGELIPRLLDSGALDAWATPVIMKKGRPALLLSVLCAPETVAALRRRLFESTPTFGVRAVRVARTALARRVETVETTFGPVRVKIGLLDGREITRTPEFEDCAARARAAGVTPRQVAEACAGKAGGAAT